MSQCIEGVAVMRSVSHENIIRLKEAFHDVYSDIFYVIMEKMEGSVYQLIRFNGGYLTEEHALVILRCTAKALAYLHSRGFVHRDVKSDNVLVGRNCEVKLADLDSVAAESAWLNGVAGTPHWVAPEVARIVCKLSDAPYTAKVDAWSFAIFAAEFALGVPPYFTGEHQPLAEICGTICNPQYVASVNEKVRSAGLPDVARLVEYGLKEEPAQRPSMSDILALMSFLDEPDQQVLLEPINRMLHRRAMTPNH
ncbi:protein kinase [Aphelenchoides avenae]|nr:protein kinase [Aphelenchus avenae]